MTSSIAVAGSRRSGTIEYPNSPRVAQTISAAAEMPLYRSFATGKALRISVQEYATLMSLRMCHQYKRILQTLPPGLTASRHDNAKVTMNGF